MSATRRISLPPDRRLGSLYARAPGAEDAGGPNWNEYDDDHTPTTGHDWDYQGLACGEVDVPANVELGLGVATDVTDLAPLAGLPPDALARLDLPYLDLSPDPLAYVAHLTGLRWLRFPAAWLTDRALAHLAGLANLRALDLAGAERVGDEGLAHLAGLAALRRLDVRGTRVTRVGFGFLAGLRALHDIQIGPAPLDDAGMVHLAGLAALEQLQLNGTAVGDAGLVQLRNHSHLRELWLAWTPIDGPGLTHLAGLTSLEVLTLTGTRVSDDDLAHLTGLTGLRRLDLDGTRVTDAGLVHLAGLTGLEWLSLNRTAVTGEGLIHLAALPNLRRLELDEAPLTEAGLEQLVDLPALRRISAVGVDVLPRSIRWLRSSMPSVSIRWGFGENVERQHWRALSLPVMSSLGTLYVRGPDFGRVLPYGATVESGTWAGWRRLGPAQGHVVIPGWLKIGLDVNPYCDGDDWLGRPGRLLSPLPTVPADVHCVLDLSVIDLDDAELAYFGDRRVLGSLDALILRGTRVTDGSLPYLAGLTALRWLDVSETNVSPGAIDALRVRRPDLEVADDRR
ncbi:MAG: hypothetical protein U0893_04180 [Chloroflexota bacterium]